MQLYIHRLQQQLAQSGYAGWLIYDFQGSNPLAHMLLHLDKKHHLTRRYLLWVPRHGRALLFHNPIEHGTWQQIAGDSVQYISCEGQQVLGEMLVQHLPKGAHIAMEYSPNGAVPYVSWVDGGTLEWLRHLGFTIGSSADLIQGLLRWSSEDYQAHRQAAQLLLGIKNQIFQRIDVGLKAAEAISEYQVQQWTIAALQDANLVFEHPPIVGFAAHAADPHYAPSRHDSAILRYGDCILLDLWGALPHRPYADITWMAVAGTPSPELQAVWEVVCGARDAAWHFLQQHWGKRRMEGWEMDQVARDFIREAGYGPAFVHRLGHSLGYLIHDNGANFDNLETHDTRVLCHGLANTIEPGIYLPERGIGVRSEINVYLGSVPEITGEAQQELCILGL